MQHTQSLCENKLFRALYARGKSATAPCMAVYARRNRLKTVSRMGISVKLGVAAQRNRMRRRLREAYRLNEGRFLPGYDIVIVARARALKRPFSVLEKEMLGIFSKLGMTAKDDEQTGIESDPVL